MRQWIDFKELRSQLSFADVLTHYGVKVTVRGEQAVGFCPLPKHEGERRSPSFSANLRRGIWQCFGCGGKGNVLDFAVRMERLAPENSSDVRTVALKLAEHFQLETGVKRRGPTDSAGQTSNEKEAEGELFVEPRTPTADPSAPARVNEPLDFELKGLQVDHPYLRKRGFSRETVQHFGIGFCPRGLMKERVAIPLHDPDGRLVGYAGRLVDDAAITERNPKYKFPTDRQRLGIQYEFRKSALLYNTHRIKATVDHLVVVEGFASVWWLHQMGVQNSVALMGASCSPEQAAIILAKTQDDGYVFAMPDGDDAGDRCAQSLFAGVGGRRWVRRIVLGSGRQPTDCSFEDLSQFFGV
jgi:DNA primase